jgi:hypothetical protein
VSLTRLPSALEAVVKRLERTHLLQEQVYQRLRLTVVVVAAVQVQPLAATAVLVAVAVAQHPQFREELEQQIKGETVELA